MCADEYSRLRYRLATAVQAVCPSWMSQSKDDLVQVGIVAVMRVAKREEEVDSLSASYLRKVAFSAVADEIRRLRRRKEISLGYKRPQIAPRMGWNRKRAANLVFRGLERECLHRIQVTP